MTIRGPPNAVRPGKVEEMWDVGLVKGKSLVPIPRRPLAESYDPPFTHMNYPLLLQVSCDHCGREADISHLVLCGDCGGSTGECCLGEGRNAAGFRICQGSEEWVNCLG